MQQYPLETQEKYNSVQSRIPATKDGMKPGFTETRGGVWKSEGFPMKGLESSFAGFGRPVVPPGEDGNKKHETDPKADFETMVEFYLANNPVVKKDYKTAT